MTNERLIGALRLVRKRKLCVLLSLETQVIRTEVGATRRMAIGLTIVVDEAERYVARAHPKARAVGIFIAGTVHRLIAPHAEGLERAK